VEQADVIVYRKLQAELKNKNLGCKAEAQAYGLYLVNIVDRFTSLNFNALLKQHAPLPEKYQNLKGQVGSILKAEAYSQRKRERERINDIVCLENKVFVNFFVTPSFILAEVYENLFDSLYESAITY
jgi:hypothetical protein